MSGHIVMLLRTKDVGVPESASRRDASRYEYWLDRNCCCIDSNKAPRRRYSLRL